MTNLDQTVPDLNKHHTLSENSHSNSSTDIIENGLGENSSQIYPEHEEQAQEQAQEQKTVKNAADNFKTSHHSIVIKQTTPSKVFPKIIFGLLGLGILGGTISYEALDISSAPFWVSLIASLAVIAFGLATILAWRQRGEFELIEIENGDVRFLTSAQGSVFQSPIEQTKIQQLSMPNGKIKVFLRDGSKAVEIAQDLTPEQKTTLVGRVHEILGKK